MLLQLYQNTNKRLIRILLIFLSTVLKLNADFHLCICILDRDTVLDTAIRGLGMPVKCPYLVTFLNCSFYISNGLLPQIFPMPPPASSDTSTIRVRSTSLPYPYQRGQRSHLQNINLPPRSACQGLVPVYRAGTGLFS